MTYPLPSQNSPKILRLMLWCFLVLLIASTSATLGAITALITPGRVWESSDPESNILNQFWQNRFQYKLSRPVNILVMGIDGSADDEIESPQDVFKGRSDTMLLVRFDPMTRGISLLSVPRDTQVEIPGFGVGKINEANYWGGPKLATEVVNNTLNEVQISRYVRVSSGAFRELVNLLGGVEVFVPYPMSYLDKTQKLKIELAAGWQTINGEQADQFARYRSDAYGDIGRIQRQQALLTAIRDRLQNPTVLPRLPEIIRVMQKYIDTNLSFEEILTLVNYGLNLPENNFKMVLLPGTNRSDGETNYWIVDERGRDRVMYQYFRIDSTGFILEESYRRSAYQGLPVDLNIAIQNASGDPQAANKVADLLASKGFENIAIVEEWPTQQLQTQIIVQSGDLGGSEVLQKTLGFGEVEAASTGKIDSDITIRVGKDWQKQF